MAVTWIVIGAALLLLTLIDTFLAVLNYNEAGIIVNRVARAQWVAIRSITRRLPRNWRSFALRQTTGIIIVTVILTWLIGVIFGFALIYYGALELGAIKLESGAPEGFWAALYLSIGQFSTVGVENMSAVFPVIDFLTVLQALTSVVMLTMIITFLFNVFTGVQMLRSLCADVSMPDAGVNEPLTVLEPYFPGGKPESLERWMQATWGDMNLYGDTLRQTRTAYYFQSGEHQFSAPFAMGTLSGIIGALRWGMPVGSSPVPSMPVLLRLEESLQTAQNWINANMIKGHSAPIPTPLSEAEFTKELALLHTPGNIGVTADEWVARFDRICRSCARLTSPDQSEQSALDADPAEVYQRYVAWLPYGAQQEHIITAISRDLDYQPLFTGVAPEPFYSSGVARPLELATAPPKKPIWKRLGAWFRRRQWFVDPGWFRASAGVTTLAAATLALFTTAAAGASLNFDASNVLAFSALLTLYVPGMVPASRNAKSFGIGLFALIPTVGMSVLAVLTPNEWLFTIFGVTITAFLAIFIGRFGPSFGSAGQLGFSAYFMALILQLNASELPSVISASVIAVLWTVSLKMIPQLAIRRRVLVDGTRGVLLRAEAVVTEVITAVGSGANSKSMQHILSKTARSVHVAGNTLGGRLSTLRHPKKGPALSDAEIIEFRMRLLDLDLAVNHLAELPFQANNNDLTVSDRAVICAELEQLNEQINSGETQTVNKPQNFIGPVVQAYLLAIRELRNCAAQLQNLEKQDFAHDVESRVPAEIVAGANASAGVSEAVAAPASGINAIRRSVQAALASAIALALGSLVSQHHQYWAAMPAFQSLQGSDGHTRSSAVNKVVFTTIGALLGFFLAFVLLHDTTLVLIVLGVCVFALGYTKGLAPLWYILWVNAMMALMYDALGSLSAELIGVRVVETLIGAVVAGLVATLVFPLRTRTKLRNALAAAIDAVSAVVRTGFQNRARTEAGDSLAVAEHLQTMATAITKYQNLALPLRNDIGSLKTSGIEASLSDLWKLAHDARLVAAPDTAAEPLSPAQSTAWSELANAARINLASLAETNAGALPRQLVRSAELSPAVACFVDTKPSEQALVASAARISSEAAHMCNTIKPGAI